MSETPLGGNFNHIEWIKRTYESMPLNKKYFIYYSRVKVSKSLNIDLDQN